MAHWLPSLFLTYAALPGIKLVLKMEGSSLIKWFYFCIIDPTWEVQDEFLNETTNEMTQQVRKRPPTSQEEFLRQLSPDGRAGCIPVKKEK